MLVSCHLLLEVRETTCLNFVPLKSLNKCSLNKWIEEWMNKWMNKWTNERKHISVEIFRSQLQIGNNEIFACEIAWVWDFDMIAKISWKECLMPEEPRLRWKSCARLERDSIGPHCHLSQQCNPKVWKERFYFLECLQSLRNQVRSVLYWQNPWHFNCSRELEDLIAISCLNRFWEMFVIKRKMN